MINSEYDKGFAEGHNCGYEEGYADAENNFNCDNEEIIDIENILENELESLINYTEGLGRNNISIHQLRKLIQTKDHYKSI